MAIGFFGSSGGLWHGDHLSPLLFVRDGSSKPSNIKGDGKGVFNGFLVGSWMVNQ